MKKCNLENETGRSMIEMLGVLAIIGVLSVGGIAGYSKAMQRYRINKTIEQITLIAGNVRAFFAPQKSYEGLNAYSTSSYPLIRKAKLIPEEMYMYHDSDGGGYKAGDLSGFSNALGKHVEIGWAHKSKTGDKQAFYMATSLGQKDQNYDICIEFLSYDWTMVGVKGIRMGGGPFIYKSMPISVDEAVNICSNVTTYTINIFFDVNSNCWSETNGNTCS